MLLKTGSAGDTKAVGVIAGLRVKLPAGRVGCSPWTLLYLQFQPPLHLRGDPPWEHQTHPARAVLPGGTWPNNSCVSCLVPPSPSIWAERKHLFFLKKGRKATGMSCASHTLTHSLGGDTSIPVKKDFQQIPEKS